VIPTISSVSVDCRRYQNSKGGVAALIGIKFDRETSKRSTVVGVPGSQKGEMRAQEHEELAGDQGNPQQGTALSAVLHRLPKHAWMRLQHISPDGWKVRSPAFFGVARVDKPCDGVSHSVKLPQIPNCQIYEGFAAKDLILVNASKRVAYSGTQAFPSLR
jgi:hypothetical protein